MESIGLEEIKRAKLIALILLPGRHQGEFGVVKGLVDGKYHVHPTQTQIDHSFDHYYSPDEIILYRRQ